MIHKKEKNKNNITSLMTNVTHIYEEKGLQDKKMDVKLRGTN